MVMVMLNPDSWKQVIGMHLKHHQFLMLSTLNASMHSINLWFEASNFFIKEGRERRKASVISLLLVDLTFHSQKGLCTQSFGGHLLQ